MIQANNVLEFLKANVWLTALASILFLFLMGALFVFWVPNTVSRATELDVVVPRGASFRSVTDSLEVSGTLRVRWTFNLAGRIMGLTRDMKVGKYRFPAGLSNLEILQDLSEGTSRVPIAVTIPEGWRIERIAIRYSQHLGIDTETFINLCRSERYVRSLGIDAESLEGYLMPDTYRFFWQTEEREIIERMLNEFKSFFVDSLKSRQKGMNMSLNQVLTLASIVEGETSLDRERTTVAGVYHNRLKRRMRLEADPTIQYIVPDGPRRLLYSDLKIDSPFNTYRNYGLPPAPIGSPGRLSILATLYPERHSYLFFVADGTGGHKFSRNYAEHQRAVREWRRARRELQQQAARNADPTGG
jgi:UPF0755 protein